MYDRNVLGIMTMNVYDSIIKGLNEAVEYEKGNVKAKTSKIFVSLSI